MAAAALARGLPGIAYSGAQVGAPLRLRLRGLPFHATVAEVHSFFNGFQVSARGGPKGKPVELLRGKGRPIGQAFVYFDDVEEAMRAKDALHRQPWGLVGTRLYRVDVLEDFIGRAIVYEEDSAGDIDPEKLLDKTRKGMVGARHKEKEQMKEMLLDMY